MKLALETEIAKKDNSNDVPSLRELSTAARTREAELLSNELAASSQMAMVTAELRLSGDTISTKSKKFAKAAHLKSSIESM